MAIEHGSAKVLIGIDGFGADNVLLFSRKRAKGTAKHKRLELLGGGLEGNNPLEGLVRELEEEERSGILAEHVRQASPSPRLVTVDGTPQYVFEVTIPLAVYLEMRHAKAESMGFVVIPRARLQDPGMADRLTGKTTGILEALGLL